MHDGIGHMVHPPLGRHPLGRNPPGMHPPPRQAPHWSGTPPLAGGMHPTGMQFLLVIFIFKTTKNSYLQILQIL